MVVIIQTSGAPVPATQWLDPAKNFATNPAIGPVNPPSDGDRWIVGAGAVGAWAGHDDDVAEYEGSTTSWVFYTPQEGDAIVVEDLDTLYIYDAINGWQINASAGIVSQKLYASGTKTTSGGGAWETVITTALSIGSPVRDVWAIATFQCTTASGPATQWDLKFRIRIGAMSSSIYTRSLAGGISTDKGLGALQHLFTGVGLTPLVYLEAQDDAVHTGSVNPAGLMFIVF